MKLGILGGTFNPIHNGHLSLAKAAMEEYKLDCIRVMPSGISYLKAGTGVLPSDIRGEMTRLACLCDDRLIYDDREMKREGNSYTCDTIAELNSEYPDEVEFYYIIGADSLVNIHRWKDIKVIFDRCHILVACRCDTDMSLMDKEREALTERYGAVIDYLRMPQIDISSTQLREMVSRGESISGLLPESVEEYIIRNKIYVS